MAISRIACRRNDRYERLGFIAIESDDVEAGLIRMSQSVPSAGVRCPRCDRVSLDLAYCEHCQSELPAAVNDSPLGFPALLIDATSTVNSAMASEWSLAALSVGWPDDPSRAFEVNVGAAAFRVRAIRPALWPDLAPEVRSRQAVSLPVLPLVHVIELGGGAIIAAESWNNRSPDAPPAGPNDLNSNLTIPTRSVSEDNGASERDEFIGVESTSSSLTLRVGVNENSPISALLEETLRVARLLNIAMTGLHDSGHVWLEFDPQAIEVGESLVRVTNLDWRLFPIGRCPSHLARISPQYSPPEVCRFHDDWIGPRTDVYHLALFVYYRLAGLWPGGFAGRGLEAFEFELPPLRVFRPDLPVGIWPVLRRALSINVAHRPATTCELIEELECAAASTPTRRVSKDVLTDAVAASLLTQRVGVDDPSFGPRSQIDLGWLTAPGRAKSALGAVNQDQAVVVSETVCGREIQLLIVADGVTHARVGTGELASALACELLLTSMRSQLATLAEADEPAWPTVLDAACVAASEAIVREALSLPDRPVPTRDNDLMSTTALIGILDGDELHLANVGDSRAYLVANFFAEQLTVDGDVASSQLALGTPPEQVQELGAAGKALRFCLGACRETESGELVVDVERARPQISHWRLKPGDTIILCSDGLVEERVFLEPEDLATIIDARHDLTSQQLAENLVAAADAKQRLPSSTEPNGYGDNITAIVLRFAEWQIHQPEA